VTPLIEVSKTFQYVVFNQFTQTLDNVFEFQTCLILHFTGHPNDFELPISNGTHYRLI